MKAESMKTKNDMPVKGIGNPYNASSRFIDENVNRGLGEKTAIYYKDQTITYKQLQKSINQVGNAFKKLSIGLEDRVLLMCYDSPEFIESFYGAIKIGAVPIPVNTNMNIYDYEYFLNNSRAKALVVHQNLWNDICEIRDRFIFLKYVIIVESDGESGDLLDYHKLRASASVELDCALTDRNDAAFWLYSSGSTGKPKGVVHLQHDMEVAYESYAKKVLQIQENDITLSASKLYFAYGLGNSMYFPLGAGGSTVLIPDRVKPEAIFEAIATYKPTLFFSVPTLYGAMINFAEQTGKTYDTSSVRLCISAGEALPAQYYYKWKEMFGLDILDGIGSTEALHIFISNSIDNIKPGSTGKAVPGYDAKIANETGDILPPNEMGDLLIKGDSVAHGYWNLHEENKQKFIGEWLHTGDKYYMDEEGYFWYCGRSDDMIKVGGIWVSPVEVENALIRHKSVLEVAVVGIQQENDPIQCMAYVVLKEGIAPEESLKKELQEFVKNELAAYKYPRIIEFIDELPKTSSGKIQRFKLRVG